VRFFVDFEFRSRLLQAVIGTVFEQAVRLMVRAFERRAMHLYGRNPAPATAPPPGRPPPPALRASASTALMGPHQRNALRPMPRRGSLLAMGYVLYGDRRSGSSIAEMGR
jgi:hypothetical protein